MGDVHLVNDSDTALSVTYDGKTEYTLQPGLNRDIPGHIAMHAKAQHPAHVRRARLDEYIDPASDEGKRLIEKGALPGAETKKKKAARKPPPQTRAEKRRAAKKGK